MNRFESRSNYVFGDNSLLKYSFSAIYCFAGISHVVFLFVFWKLGVKEMQIANYFSPVFYIAAIVFNQKNYVAIGATLGIFEAVVHGILSLYYVGWQAYFHIYIVFVYLLIFFLYNFNLVIRILIAIFITLLLLGLIVYAGLSEPKYQLPKSFIIYSGILNIVSTAAVLSLFAITYSHFIRKNIDILKNAEEQQRSLNAQKNKFFSIFSHDLKNPIASLNGLSDLILFNYESLNEEKRKDFLTQIQSSASDLKMLVEGMLDWSRSQLDNAKMNPILIDVGPTMLEIQSLFEPQALQKEIKLDIRVTGNAKIYADEQMFRSAIRNLISNSIKFTHRGGKITVRAEQEQSKTTVTVIDTGIGIKPEAMDNLFSIDKLIIGKGTERETGTGLGLIVTKEFIEKNKGTISVESIPEQGTKITVTLPSK
jgi:signal transduction histidine kinase